MRTVSFDTIVSTVKALCIQSCYELPADVVSRLAFFLERETSPGAVDILEQLLENARLARDERIPLCQDTGLAVVFLEIGRDFRMGSSLSGDVESTIIDAVHAGVSAGYDCGYLRKSVVSEPLNYRSNTGTNTPAIVHTELVPGDRLLISVMSKGGGCENKSQFKMFLPTASREAVTDWISEVVLFAGANACPPFVVGVGLGGNFERSWFLSKKALLRNLESCDTSDFYADMERQLLLRINSCGLGPQGLGGDTTALAVLIETSPCHIASLPVAVNIECHAHRHASALL